MKPGHVIEVLRLRLECGRWAEVWKDEGGEVLYQIGGTGLTEIDLKNLAVAAKRMAARE